MTEEELTRLDQFIPIRIKDPFLSDEVKDRIVAAYQYLREENKSLKKDNHYLKEQVRVSLKFKYGELP